MRALTLAVMLAWPMMGQTAAEHQPIVARGRLLELDTGQSGEFSIRTGDNRVYWYVYDPKTYVEQDEKMTAVPKLHKGDEIEIVSDTGPDAALRYARTIHVVESPQEAVQPHRFTLGRYAVPRHPVTHDDPEPPDFLYLLRATLTFSGQICRLNDERFVLRTRTEGEKTIYMRPDTRYMEDGSVVPAKALRLNTRVFVRGSKNLDGEIEAFQVVWGRILEPGPGDH